VDADALLSMEREELADTLIASHFDAASRKRDALVNVRDDARFKYLVAHNSDGEGFFLIWNGTKGNTDFTERHTKRAPRRPRPQDLHRGITSTRGCIASRRAT